MLDLMGRDIAGQLRGFLHWHHAGHPKKRNEVASIDREILIVLDLRNDSANCLPKPSRMEQFELNVKAETIRRLPVNLHEQAWRQLRNVRFQDLKDYAAGLAGVRRNILKRSVRKLLGEEQ